MEDVAQFLQQALNAMQVRCSDLNVKSGVISDLANTAALVRKIRDFNAPKTIGVFGGQKRGKSSLINELIGYPLMPVKVIPMSSAVIRIQNDESSSPGHFLINIQQENGSNQEYDVNTLEHAQELLIQFGSHKGGLGAFVDTIEVISNFNQSRILKSGGILIDTPGAESAFENALDNNSLLQDNSVDMERALKILKDAHNVIFLERAGYAQSSNSKKFFDDNLRSFRPLCVMNFKDNYQPDNLPEDPNKLEQMKQDKLKQLMLKTFSIRLDRIHCISSKEAKIARENNDMELLKQSGIPDLETKILSDLNEISQKKGLSVCLREMENTLSHLPDQSLACDIFAGARRAFFVFISQLKKMHEPEYLNILRQAECMNEKYQR